MRAEKPCARLDESLLSHVSPFLGLEPAQIRSILDQARLKHLDTGVAVFEEADEATRFFLLLDGYLQVVRHSPGGDQVILLYILPGELFGIAAAVGQTAYPATAISASPSICLSWPATLFDPFRSQYPGFDRAVRELVGKRLIERNDRLLTLATQKVEQRVAKAVLQLTQHSGRPVPDGTEIAFPITREDVSEMTATTLHTASRLLSAWEREGIIVSRRKRIIVSNPERLGEIAAG